MTMQTYIEFFKKEELINNNNLMSVAQGEEALAKASAGWYAFFKQLSDNANHNVKAIIAGWRRGYSADAVADWIVWFAYDVNKVVGNSASTLETTLTDQIFDIMGYRDEGWGGQYAYHPALNESNQDPLNVQRDINNRAAAVSKLTGDEVITFGVYQNGTGALRRDKEFDAVSEFRAQVKVALLARRDTFFLETTADDGDGK